MYKLIVCDFDKTLINDDEEIEASTIVLIDELRRKGIKFAVATGRALDSITYYNRDFPFIDYIIASNGAYIYDTNKDKTIFKKNIGIRNIKKIIKSYYDKSIIYLVNDKTWNLISKKSAYSDDTDTVIVDNIEEFLNKDKNNIYKIELYFKTKKEAEKTLNEIRNLELDINATLIINDKKYIVDITHFSVNKLKGVELIVNKLNISMDNVISFGDGLNDIELLQKSGCGVAMKNASKELQKVADNITALDNNSKGVEMYLKELEEDYQFN